MSIDLFKHPAVKNTPHLMTHLRLRGICETTNSFGWGVKPLSRLMRLYSGLMGRKFISCEDGFISYFGHPSLGSPRTSIIMDESGIYYDASRASDLEIYIEDRVIYHEARETEDVITKLISDVNKLSIGKYNTPQCDSDCSDVIQGSLLVVDQVLGDMSLVKGFTGSSCGDEMIKNALKLAGGRDVYIKYHPDVLLNKKGAKGLLSSVSPELLARCKPLPAGISKAKILDLFSDVFVATSQFGFECLLGGLTVHCFGIPFYSHWGLTEDNKVVSNVWARRGARVVPSINDVFMAAYSDYSTYVDYETGMRLSLEEQVSKFKKNDDQKVVHPKPPTFTVKK